jgi:type II secretory pathway component PulM
MTDKTPSDACTGHRRLLKTGIAGIILLAFFGTWLAMEWTGRQPDSLILLGAVAIAVGAGYYLWDDSMGEGVQAVDELQSDGDSGGNDGS